MSSFINNIILSKCNIYSTQLYEIFIPCVVTIILSDGDKTFKLM